ncbi:MAG: protoporphyrinogen oxidase HemJ [Beijerinckiaceae bacterium]
MYLWLKALHIVAVISWMAGLLYLPRLMVYHAVAAPGSELSETLKVMEHRLLRFIMTPAMMISWIVGFYLAFAHVGFAGNVWLHVKLLLVIAMSASHGFMARWVREFAEDRNTRPQRFYRIANEVPTLLMLGIVVLAVVKPF